MLKELEDIETNMVDTIFQYNKADLKELEETKKQVTKEYKSGNMDPSAYLKMNAKNKIKKAKAVIKKKVNI